MTEIPELVHVASAKALPGHRLALVFSNGAEGVADLSWIASSDGPMVQPLKDEAFFARVFVEMGAPTWPNGYDMDPSNLHHTMKLSGELTRSVAAE